MHKRDSTGLERYRRWEERTRAAGRQRLVVWIPSEAFSRLRALAQTRDASLAEVVAALITESAEKPPKAVKTNGTAKHAGAGLDPRITALVREWRAAGASWAECARRLDEKGIPTPTGKRWLFGQGQTNLHRHFPA